MEIQIVSFRFGEKYLVNEFIQSRSYEIVKLAKQLNSESEDETIKRVSLFIRDGFEYPLDQSKNPSTDGRFERYKKSILPNDYQFKAFKYYVWAFPVEVLISKLGYCAETANLMTSILRACGIDAYTGLGEVRKTSTDELLGYHAWTVMPYQGQEHLDETTIHREVNTLIPSKDIYDKVSSFAKIGDVYYVEHARYDDFDYIGATNLGKSGIIFSLIGKPLKLLNVLGLDKLQQLKPKRLYREWRREECVKSNHIQRAFR
jgi:hypothetical protein